MIIIDVTSHIYNYLQQTKQNEMEKKINQKLLTTFILIILAFGTNNSFSQENNTIASCCEEMAAKCTGSSNCRACTNCSRCKYCNNGGSCGVCSIGNRRTNTRTYTPKSNSYYNSIPSSNSNSNNRIRTNSTTKNTNSSGVYNLPDDIISEYYLKTVIVSALTLNLRKGPGTTFGILETLNRDQELIFLAMTGEWLKVKVKSTNTIGFVHNKYITVLTE